MSVFDSYPHDELLSYFSDFYKEVNGFRPRGWDRERMVEWLEYNLQPEVQKMHQAQWEAEARRLDEMEAEMEAAWKEDQLRLEAEQEELYQEAKERMFYEMEVALA